MSFLPYLTLHMQQLGLAVEQIAIIYAVLPIASLLGPPIAGKIISFYLVNRIFLKNIYLFLLIYPS